MVKRVQEKTKQEVERELEGGKKKIKRSIFLWIAMPPILIIIAFIIAYHYVLKVMNFF